MGLPVYLFFAEKNAKLNLKTSLHGQKSEIQSTILIKNDKIAFSKYDPAEYINDKNDVNL